ncbi:MAG: GNAT family N-acetyltransferase [Devosia sp.]
MAIVYAQENDLGVEDYAEVLRNCAMRHKRPVDNLDRLEEMLRGANFIVTARENGKILGFARCLTDHAWVCFCSDLAVKENAQGRGVGRGILETCWRLLGPRIGFTLLSERDTVGFYEAAGMTRWDAGFYRTREDKS